MNKKINILASVFLTALFLSAGLMTSCGSSNADNKSSGKKNSDVKKEQVSQATSEKPGQKAEAQSAKEKFPLGAKIYNEKCITCHMEDGKGVEGVYPPLANSDYLMADKERAVLQVINGSEEKMVVNGVTYNIPMPPQEVTKKEAVAVVNFVLNNWDNDGGTISMEKVDFSKKK